MPLRRSLIAILLLLASAMPMAAQHPPADDTPEPQAEQPDEKEKPEDKWDVQNPAGPSYEIPIDTTSGTWMSVDVSPDGTEIAFDLLGDLYVMPISGGEARAVTTGVAWDMQPRYSPNGRWIAFTSDRSGGDNIWIVPRDGGEPQQVTKETFRLLNSPSWSPDSEFIVARKHFTSRRSLGAGEMWLYHRSGGEGIQLTEKPNDQKDAGEPALSPDGRYLYYSQDVTPGAFFQYNKDPNGEIYVIQRLDRETGQTRRYITGPGGSIRPTPSPDGKRLAFVRRVRLNTVLFVADLETGEETPLFDGLDRDMQETWAIHGVYPSMGWTPDNNSLVFWANGKLHRVNVASKAVSEIPFRVRGARKVYEALRFPTAVAPEEFSVSMLRWVEVSPQGNQVVYQALGHLWIRDLPNGAPRRLTRQNDHFEFYPSFSRDGNSIVYVSWDDEKLGAIRVAPARGGEGRVVTRAPGHFAEPIFTPDGRRIVYRASAGGDLKSPLYSRDRGLFVIPAAGGEAALVTENGFLPQFGRDNDRLYFMTVGEEDKRFLKSIELDGSKERTHLSSEAATEFQIAPDEKWIAFTQRFNVWILPFFPAGKSFEVAPDMKSLPAKRVSRDSGEYLHWSADSKRLYWSLGPELFSRDIRETFAFVEGAPEELPEPPEQGIPIGFTAQADIPTGKIALVGARIITMRGNEVIEDGTVVVERNRITAIGPRASVAVPSDARRIDVAGKTIIPGLIDVHWHGSMGDDEIIPEQSWVNLASLAFGVTTIHDPSNDTSEIFAHSEMARAGRVLGPRIFSTGAILYGAKASFTAHVESLEDARSHLRRMKAVGAFSVKSYNQPRRDQRQQFIVAARELEMMVLPEGGSLFQHNMTMVVDGHTGIEHAIPVARIYDDVYQLWPNTRTWYTPTLVVGYGGIWGENYWYQHTNVWENQRLLNFVPRRIIDQRSRRRMMVPEDDFNHFQNARVAAELAERGVHVQVGAHGQREGLAAHWETWMFVQGGMSPHEALRSSTLRGAEYFGMERDLGSLEPGKLADLLVLSQNPLENIRHSESIELVMANGRLFDAMTMNETGNHPRQRAPLFFEREGGSNIAASAGHSTHDH
ncbi:MAG TPA: amidohydrolase family protein [Thermoanaerobaculia bacterium]|nr:amidohydrolase family protein [Thermoanaerobaculia bacterium]